MTISQIEYFMAAVKYAVFLRRQTVCMCPNPPSANRFRNWKKSWCYSVSSEIPLRPPDPPGELIYEQIKLMQLSFSATLDRARMMEKSRFAQVFNIGLFEAASLGNLSAIVSTFFQTPQRPFSHAGAAQLFLASDRPFLQEVRPCPDPGAYDPRQSQHQYENPDPRAPCRIPVQGSPARRQPGPRLRRSEIGMLLRPGHGRRHADERPLYIYMHLLRLFAPRDQGRHECGIRLMLALRMGLGVAVLDDRVSIKKYLRFYRLTDQCVLPRRFRMG